MLTYMADDASHNVSWWQGTPEAVLEKIGTGLSGLSNKTVLERRKQYGLNVISNKKTSLLTIFIRQFTGNPLIIILAIATIVSYFLGQHDSSYYIFGIIIASVLLGLWNEYSAVKTVEDLLKKISPTALVEREGEKLEVPVTHLTIGDIVLLSQGTIIPADLRLIESNDLEVNQSALTGEAKTVFKTSEALPGTPKNADNIDNFGYMGTSVVSGSARGVVSENWQGYSFWSDCRNNFICPSGNRLSKRACQIWRPDHQSHHCHDGSHFPGKLAAWSHIH